jgi:cytidylate kinase
MNVTKDLIIAIDGPSGAGKSTAAKSVAARLSYLYLESGALYRAVAWKVIHEGIDPGNMEALKDLCRRIEISLRNIQGRSRIWVDQKDITDELKTPLLDRVSSQISAVASVRERLLDLQRQIGHRGGVVIEGRDIGSVVFPDADLKFYLDASTEVRAERRHDELGRKGYEVSLASVREEIQLRDQRDIQRHLAPLKRPEDAIYIDTTHLTLDQVVDTMMGEIKEKIRV